MTEWALNQRVSRKQGVQSQCHSLHGPGPRFTSRSARRRAGLSVVGCHIQPHGSLIAHRLGTVDIIASGFLRAGFRMPGALQDGVEVERSGLSGSGVWYINWMGCNRGGREAIRDSHLSTQRLITHLQ